MKRLSVILLSIVLFLAAAYLGVNWWLAENLQYIINNNPDREYELRYDELEVKPFLDGVTFRNLSIDPTQKENTTPVYGKVKLVEIKGIQWKELLLDQAVVIDEIIFLNPAFEIIFSNDTISESGKSGQNVQQLFGDILSRADLKKFSLLGGSAQARFAEEDRYVAQLSNFHLVADDIEIDSVQLKYLIPFQVGDFSSSADNIMFEIDSVTHFTCGKIAYSSTFSQLSLQNISLQFSKDWRLISNEIGRQIDLVEFELKSLEINHLDAESKISGDLDLRAGSIVIDSLVLDDYRDKNQPNPPDVKKPLFEGLVEAIPFPLKVDTILLANSQITYHELGVDKPDAGLISFNDTYGSIYNITTIPSFQQQYQQFEADLITRINNTARGNIRLVVPYGKEEFKLGVQVDSFSLLSLNSVTVPLVDIEAQSGRVLGITLAMDATQLHSSNKLILDYDELSIRMLQTGKSEEPKTRGLMSKVANVAIRRSNLPDEKGYLTAEYQTQRDIHRGAFNLMWQSIKDGLTLIVPIRAAQTVTGQNKKRKNK